MLGGQMPWVHDLGRRPGLAANSAVTTAASGIAGRRASPSTALGFGSRQPTSPAADYGRNLSHSGLCPTATARAEAAGGQKGTVGPDPWRCRWASLSDGRLGRSSSSPQLSRPSSNSSSGRFGNRSRLGAFGKRKGATARGWLPYSFESAEVSELAESARALFAAYDTTGDGRVDLSEFVETQALLCDAIGVKTNPDAAAHQFYEMANARHQGSVSFAEFFRAEQARLRAENQADSLAPALASRIDTEWPRRIMWNARQISLGQQRLRLKALGVELAKLASEARLPQSISPEAATSRSQKIRELRRQRQRELEGCLVVRGVASNGDVRLEGALVEVTAALTDSGATSSVCASKGRSNALGTFEQRLEAQPNKAFSLAVSAEGCCTAFRMVSGEGLRQVGLELAPLGVQGCFRAEVGKQGFKTFRDTVSGASFDVPIGDLLKDGRAFEGEVVFGAAVVDMGAKEAVEALPFLYGRCAVGEVAPLQCVAGAYLKLQDAKDGAPLKVRASSDGIEVTLPARAMMPTRQPSLWCYDTLQGLWEETDARLASDERELPQLLLEPDPDRTDEDQLCAADLPMPWGQEAVINAEAQLNAIFGRPGARHLKSSRFYSSSAEAQRALPLLQILADYLVEGCKIFETASGRPVQDIDPRALRLLALQRLISMWAVPVATVSAPLMEMREALQRSCGSIPEAFLAVAGAQACREEAFRVRQMLRARDPHKVTTYRRIELALDGNARQEKLAADLLAADVDLHLTAELERVREAVQALLPGACPSTRELGLAQAEARAKARQAAAEAAAAKAKAAEAEGEVNSLTEQLAAAKAAKSKGDTARLTDELAAAQTLCDEVQASARAAEAAAVEAASLAKAAEVLANDPKQQERANEKFGTSVAWSPSRKKEVKKTFTFQVFESGWECVAAPQAPPLQKNEQPAHCARPLAEACCLVLGCIENASSLASVTAMGSRLRIVDRSDDVMPEGYFSLLVMAGTQFEIKVLHDDFETAEYFGPFVAEAPGRLLHLGVLSSSGSSPPVPLEVAMPSVAFSARVEGSRRNSNVHGSRSASKLQGS
eukprot:TRINITY_DN74673_c0_g1_i1.p1 TRINITY_DN74673_c0_g1~~TRINITY_DN74673_c0_g1_i1.p1  ORF type:complete len:1063 (+),score=218.03 TRINITY_DN74673_c0_g1_i1:49-3237(+)